MIFYQRCVPGQGHIHYILGMLRITIRICMIFLPEVCLGTRTYPLHFRDAPDYDSDLYDFLPEVCPGTRTYPLHFGDAPDYDSDLYDFLPEVCPGTRTYPLHFGDAPNYDSDLHDFFTRGVSRDKNISITFWRCCGLRSESRIRLWWFAVTDWLTSWY